MSSPAPDTDEPSRTESSAPSAGPRAGTPRWRRKTPQEFARDEARQDRRNLSPVQPLIIAGVCFLIGCMLGMPAVFTVDRDPVLWIVVPGLVCGILGLILAYTLQAAGWITMPKRLRMGICNSCFKIVLEDRERCECGGSFEDIDGWTLNSCPKCGYDLRGGTPGRCPECGSQIVLYTPDTAPVISNGQRTKNK